MDAPAAAVSADGKTIALGWMDLRRGRQERDVFWRIVKNGKPGPEMALAKDQDGTQGNVALAVDDNNVVHAVWESEGRILYRNSKAPENRTISSDSEREATQPSLTFGGGRLVVAYECRSAGGRQVIVRVVR